MSLVLRLAVGSGRAALARLALVVGGTAAATALLLVAAGLANIGAEDIATSWHTEMTFSADGRLLQRVVVPDSGGPLTNSYLAKPELRRGVVIGFVLCVVPLLVFVAVASRVAARRREERLAALRLAGATNRDVRLLALLDTAVGTGAGTLLGAVAYLAWRAVTMNVASGQLAAVARVATPPLWLAALVAVALVVTLSAGSALALRALRITPLGVVRRAPRRHPRPWGLLLLLTGLGAFAALLSGSVPDTFAGDASIGLALAAAMLGLVTCGPWLVSRTGRLMAALPFGPAWLLAGRRLEEEPRAAARALSSVTLVVLAAAVGLVALEDFRNAIGHTPGGDGFAVQGFGFAFAGMLLSGLVAAAGLLLTTLEAMLERRRTVTRLLATGTGAGTLRRSVLLQAAVPALPASVLATLAGLAAISALYGTEYHPGVPPALAALPLVAVAACVVAALPAVLAVPRTPDLEQLRAV
jgi:hypothetical protein